jgi:toxin secretion/phage lysis holin
MHEQYAQMKAKLAILPGVVTGLIAGLSPLVWGLFWLQSIDIATGLLASKTSWSSAFANIGMQKKIMMWMYVLVGHLLKSISPVPIDFPVDAMIAGYYCVVEVISIMENGAKMGIPAPAPLMKVVKVFTKLTVSDDGESVTATKTIEKEVPAP